MIVLFTFLFANFQQGVEFAKTTKMPSLTPRDIPAYQGVISVSEENLAEDGLRAVSCNEAAKYVVEKPKTKFDVETNNKLDEIINNPEKFLEQNIVKNQTSVTNKPFNVTCLQSGNEQTVRCNKYLIVELKVTPGYSRSYGYCPGHKKRDGFHYKHWEHPGGCQTRTTYVAKKVEVEKEYWRSDCANLEDLTDKGVCIYERVTKQDCGTKTIDGEPVNRSHWQETYEYRCFKKVPNQCKSLRNRGCKQIASKCLEKLGDHCLLFEQTYQCNGTIMQADSYIATGYKTPFCLTGNCVDASYELNNELMEALATMYVLGEAQKDIRAQIGIFKGGSKACRRNCIDFRDCCGVTGKGWGMSLHLASCSGEEKELALQRGKNRCILIGTYCAEKVAGVCIKKKTTFCCFPSKLARLIQDQGRRQLGLGFGDVKCPDCRGLSPEELSRIDFSKIDMSEIYNDIIKNFKPPTAESTIERIKTNAERLTR